MVVTKLISCGAVYDFGLEDLETLGFKTLLDEYNYQHSEGFFVPELVKSDVFSIFIKFMNDKQRVAFLTDPYGKFKGIMEYSSETATNPFMIESFVLDNFPELNGKGSIEDIFSGTPLLNHSSGNIGYISMFEIFERKQGYGRKLHDCIRSLNNMETMLLSSWDYKSTEFYKKLGYSKLDYVSNSMLPIMIAGNGNHSKDNL